MTWRVTAWGPPGVSSPNMNRAAYGHAKPEAGRPQLPECQEHIAGGKPRGNEAAGPRPGPATWRPSDKHGAGDRGRGQAGPAAVWTVVQ